MVSQIRVVNRTNEKVPSNFVKKISGLFLKTFSEDKLWESQTLVSLTIVFVTDSEMQEMNKTYRNNDVTTDVLSFCTDRRDSYLYSEDLSGANELDLGDILVSYHKVKQNAIRYGALESEELARVVTHGLLHLLGYEHEGGIGEDQGKMLQLQESFIKHLVEKGFIT